MNVDFSAFFERASSASSAGKRRPEEVAAAGASKKLKGAPQHAPGAAAAADVAAASAGGGSRKNKKKQRGPAADASAAVGGPAARAPSGGGAPSSAVGGRPAGKRSAESSAESKQPESKAQTKLREQLAGARFRDINEQLYTQDSEHAVSLFNAQPELFHAYHEGFRLQARAWPLRPVDAIVDWLRAQPRQWVVADIGCGDAEIAERAEQTVLSFDLVAAKPSVVACDAAALPLAAGAVDVAVFCLALMGSNYVDFLREARRVLKPRGLLRVAEVKSRYADVEAWLQMMSSALGFELLERDESNTHFVTFEFRKAAMPAQPANASVPLKPCLYKRR